MDTVHTIGRRKTSVARIFVSEGKGAITVNQKDYTTYFPGVATVSPEPLTLKTLISAVVTPSSAAI